jgi:hypothetical protein
MHIKKFLFFTSLVLWFTSHGKKDSNEIPGTVIYHHDSDLKIYVGSPSILILPDGTYLASHDIFGRDDSPEENKTHIYRSENRGRSWKKITVIDNQFWSNFFYHNRAIYLMGASRKFGYCIIRKSIDGGFTWTTPVDDKSGIIYADGEYHTAPMPVAIHNGRIWRAMEDRNPPEKWGVNFRSFLMSAPVDADLLRADSWTSTNRLRYNQDWPGNAWLEGNVIKAPNGKLVNILRNNYQPVGGRACLLELSDDEKTLSFDPETGFLDFPGGSKKFTIRFDEKSGLYWSLANYMPEKFRNDNPERTRNTLALISSKDLINWSINRIVLQHPNVKKVGFQYIDWQFDGKDIVAVSRTAFSDEKGEAHNSHDANYLTFHRVKKFRKSSK